MRIFENQTDGDQAVVSREIEGIGRLAARRYYFSSRARLEEGAFLDGGTLRVRTGGAEFSCRRDISPLVGTHNTENLLCAVLIARLYGIDGEIIEKTLADFKGLPHRVEFVREVEGRPFLQRFEGNQRGCGTRRPWRA